MPELLQPCAVTKMTCMTPESVFFQRLYEGYTTHDLWYPEHMAFELNCGCHGNTDSKNKAPGISGSLFKIHFISRIHLVQIGNM